MIRVFFAIILGIGGFYYLFSGAVGRWSGIHFGDVTWLNANSDLIAGVSLLFVAGFIMYCKEEEK